MFSYCLLSSSSSPVVLRASFSAWRRVPKFKVASLGGFGSHSG